MLCDVMCGELDFVDNEGYLVMVMLFCWGTRLFVLLCGMLVVVGFCILVFCG